MDKFNQLRIKKSIFIERGDSMTTIKLKVIDENIEFTSSPPIYSGGINTISTLFDFGDIWESFTKTAVFYREITKPYQVVLKDDECLIPHEVMTTAGRIYIGVFGVKGDKVKTSEVVFYDIGTGVMTFGSISEPSDEIWQQILAELGNIRELAEQMKLDQEAFKTDITKIQSDFEIKVTKKQDDFETTITNKQNNFETEITERQEDFEQRVENKTGYTRDEADERFIPTVLQGTFKTDLSEEYKGVASDFGAEILKIEGKSEQATTTGANILNTDIYNEFIEFSATKGTYLTLMTNGVPSNGGNIKFVCTDDSEEWFAIDKGKNRVYRAIRKDVKGFCNLLAPKDGLKYMLAVGDIKTYEPFTGGEPSPNPNYPQEINNSLDEPLVSVGRNLFDASRLPTKTQGGATITNNGDGSFTVSGGGNLTDNFYIQYDVVGNAEVKKLLKVGTLHLKTIKGIRGQETNPYFHIYISNKENERLIVLDNDGKGEITQSVLDKAEKITFTFWGNNGETIQGGTIKPMVYQDGDGTWEPFRYAETPLNIELRSLPDGTCDTYDNGVITRRVGVIKVDGNTQFASLNTNQNIAYLVISKYSISENKFFSGLCDKAKVVQTWNLKPNEITIMESPDLGGMRVLFSVPEEVNTLELLKAYFTENPMTVYYPLKTPTTEIIELPIIPTFYPYTNIFQSDNVKAKIQYALRSKADDIAEELKEHENEINTKLDSYKVKGDFAVISNNINLTNGDGQLDLSYPSGFNKDNCVCIAAGLAFQNAIGYIFNDYPYGSFEVRFKTDRITCIVGDNGQVTGPTGAKPIRIVLMKV